VAKILWPHKPIIEAQRELLDCLNRDRPQKLCIEEFMAVLRMAHDAGFHQAKHWIDEALATSRRCRPIRRSSATASPMSSRARRTTSRAWSVQSSG
jgi:hypothetical protein